MPKALMDMTKADIGVLMGGWGEPSFRVNQVYQWLMRGVPPKEMHNIPKALRERLDVYPFGGAETLQKHPSRIDGTVKYLFQLGDGELVEGVLMRYQHGNTLCVSTQVGCRMGCAFCASTLGGLVRNLAPGEILGQVLAVERDEGGRGGQRAVTNIVLMGSGEPLDNYKNVLAFLWRVMDKEGVHVSPRNISLSTCGVVPNIYKLIDEALHITLCISLHAVDNALRSRLMPLNKTYPVEDVLKAGADYAIATGRRVIFEYALIRGVNDAREDAHTLAIRLKHMLCHVNVIPLNHVERHTPAGVTLTGVSRSWAAKFVAWLQEEHISATLRRRLGADIEGACGQLRRRVLSEQSGGG
ncbi:MAG: 23S rRNA (adenine(2503)-C(2))-methyltransferase RlmN [Clostridiales bacterium]|jgi:23S rRNA (adenine2503-C2)-methyltransferase|nr:23S rRNA (adenine(2503)-C(2))-methyltransferase RlmN [Clostridiales bacterium]